MERTDFEQWKGKEVARLLALVETERRYYQEIVAALPVGIAVLSGERAIVLANRAFRQTLGLSAEEIRGKTIEQILPSDQLLEKIRSVHLQNAEAASRGSMTLDFAGKRLRAEVRAIRSWDEDLELETLVAIQEVAESGARSVHPMAVGATAMGVPAIDANPPRPVVAPAEVAPPVPAFPTADLPAIVWQADATTLRFTAVSGSANALLGYAPADWLNTGGFFEGRMHPEDREAAMALYRSIFEKGGLEIGGEASAEFRMVSATGDPQWCRETIAAAAPSEGSRKVYGVLTLIGERVQMQRQMEVAARNAALRSASARLAHDLNNPLMLIAGYAEEMLRAFPEGDTRREDAEQIIKATERIADLTARLLRFTRRGTTSPGSVDLPALMTRLEPKIARICGEGVQTRIETAAKPAHQSAPIWAFADTGPLEELLIALAGAACQGPGCTELRITCDSATIAESIPSAPVGAGAYARIAVRGNGAGLEGGKSEALFESIFSGEALAHAYGLAREWGGDLVYHGDASHSTFILYLRPSEPAAPQPQAVRAAAPEPLHPVILVVDDEPGIRALVAKILRREQYEVVEASTATEAGTLAATQSRPVELLVTDVMLPDQPGTTLAQYLCEQLPALKVLYMSGYTDDERARTGDFPPGAKFLQKPFTLGALVTKVRESLEQA
jgi:PAS domain S-box-containing protein